MGPNRRAQEREAGTYHPRVSDSATMRALGAAGNTMSKSAFMRHATGFCFASALLMFVAGSVAAAPVLSGTAAVKSAARTAAIDAQWRRWGWRRGWRWRRGYFIGPVYRYGWYGSGCHIPGGYYRPNACW
jgi:hypothetical protein